MQDVDMDLSWQDAYDYTGCSLAIYTSKGACQMEFENEGAHGYGSTIHHKFLSEDDLVLLQKAINKSLKVVRSYKNNGNKLD